MADKLAGQVALITGGGRGLGRGIAQDFAAEGASVAVTARSSGELDETVSLIKAAGGTAIALTGDVSDPASVRQVCEVTESQLSPVSILVNNAGINGPYGPIWEVDPEDWWQAQEIHLRGTFMFCNLIVKGMVARGGGRVINVVSGAANQPTPNFSGYGVAKAAMVRLSENLALEGKEHGIIAFPMSPGLVITELAEWAMRDPGAQRWRPDFVERLNSEKAADNFDEAMAKVTRLSLALATGQADALSGRHFNPNEDVAEVLKAEAAG